MSPYANIAYAKLKLDFDHEQFAYEFDRYILTRSQPQYNEVYERDILADLNRKWGMVEPDLYAKCDSVVHRSWQERSEVTYQRQGQPSWVNFALTEIDDNELDDPVLVSANRSGSPAARNGGRHKNWHFKSVIMQKNLQIVNWIQSHLELAKIGFVNGVSLEPGRFATIHRDSMPLSVDTPNTVLSNGIYREGFVVLNINISNGGVPLYWSLDGEEVERPRFADDAVYMTSDYFLHGVPVVKSRRRQIRITGIPNKNFHKLVDWETAVVIPNNYQYDNKRETLSADV